MKTFLLALISLMITAEGSFHECKGSWTLFEEACFKLFVLPDPMDFYAASESCQRENAQLASIKNQEEMGFVLGLCSDSLVRDSSFNPWIGIIRTKNGSDDFKWIDGTVADYFPWGEMEPNNYEGDEDCGELIVSPRISEMLPTGSFNDKACFSTSHSYLCKHMVAAATRTTEPAFAIGTTAVPSAVKTPTTTHFDNYTSETTSNQFTMLTNSNSTVTTTTTTTVETSATQSQLTTITTVVTRSTSLWSNGYQEMENEDV